MSGLLQKAIPVHDYYADIDSIPQMERDSIYSEMEKAISTERTAVTDQTFKYISLRNDRILPLILNIVAVLLTVTIGFSLKYYFRNAEQEIITGARSLNLTENQIIIALKEESDEKLSEKESEINKIQNEMNSLVQQQSLLLSASRIEIEGLKTRLRERLEDEMDKQEETLIQLGLSPEELERQLNDLKNVMEAEFIRQQLIIEEEAEQNRLQKENELMEKIAGYQQSLDTARLERDTLSEEFSNRVEKIRTGYVSETQSLRAEYSKLMDRNTNELFILNQINESYSSIAASLSAGRYEESLEKIRNLEVFLEKESYGDYPGIVSRKPADLSLLASMRSLITLKSENKEGNGLLLDEIRKLKSDGDALTESGEIAEARNTYIRALSLVPLLGEAYDQLRKINDLENTSRMIQFADAVQQGTGEMKSGSTEVSLALYRDALRILTGGEDGESLIDGVLQIGVIEAVRSADRSKSILWQNTLTALDNLQRSEEGNFSTPSNIIEMLERKMIIKEALTSDAVREEFPEAARNLDEYLEEYSRIMKNRGASASLREVTMLLRSLSGKPLESESEDIYEDFISAMKDLSKSFIFPE